MATETPTNTVFAEVYNKSRRIIAARKRNQPNDPILKLRHLVLVEEHNHYTKVTFHEVLRTIIILLFRRSLKYHITLAELKEHALIWRVTDDEIYETLVIGSEDEAGKLTSEDTATVIAAILRVVNFKLTGTPAITTVYINPEEGN